MKLYAYVHAPEVSDACCLYQPANAVRVRACVWHNEKNKHNSVENVFPKSSMTQNHRSVHHCGVSYIHERGIEKIAFMFESGRRMARMTPILVSTMHRNIQQKEISRSLLSSQKVQKRKNLFQNIQTLTEKEW